MPESDVTRHRGPAVERLLNRRKGVAASLFVSSATMGVIALYQIGIIRHLPDFPLAIFDADRVHSSKKAYPFHNVPDAFLGLLNLAISSGLNAWGGASRVENHPVLAAATIVKLGLDTTLATKLTCDSWRLFRALSSWSLVSAAAGALALWLSVPEGEAGWRKLMGVEPTRDNVSAALRF